MNCGMETLHLAMSPRRSVGKSISRCILINFRMQLSTAPRVTNTFRISGTSQPWSTVMKTFKQSTKIANSFLAFSDYIIFIEQSEFFFCLPVNNFHFPL